MNAVLKTIWRLFLEIIVTILYGECRDLYGTVVYFYSGCMNVVEGLVWRLQKDCRGYYIKSVLLGLY